MIGQWMMGRFSGDDMLGILHSAHSFKAIDTCNNITRNIPLSSILCYLGLNRGALYVFT